VEWGDGKGAIVDKRKGSRSGKHREGVGGSDSEIAELSSERKEKAKVKGKKDAWPEDEKDQMV